MGSGPKRLTPREKVTKERRDYAQEFRPASNPTPLGRGERHMRLNMADHGTDYKDRTYNVRGKNNYKYTGGGEPQFYGRLASDGNSFKLNEAGRKKTALGSG